MISTLNDVQTSKALFETANLSFTQVFQVSMQSKEYLLMEASTSNLLTTVVP